MGQLTIQDPQVDDRIAELAEQLDQISRELRALCLAQPRPPRLPRSQSLTGRIRQNLVNRHVELFNEFEDQPFSQDVLQHWYKKTTPLSLADCEITKNNYKPRWVNALSSAIEDDRCQVIKKVGRDRYVVTPLSA
jgi:hypothetical protein